MKIYVCVLVAILLTGCAPTMKTVADAPTSRPSRLVIQPALNGAFSVQGMQVEASELRQLVQELGPDRPITVEAGTFEKALKMKKELQQAGLRDVVIAPAVGG
ncbi:MAG TPA: hypothetical protein VF796_19545 [Humisphaera sp.]